MTRTPLANESIEPALELSLLQLLRLKGRASAAGMAANLNLDVDAAAAALATATANGYATETGASFRVTPEGKRRLADLLEQERAGVDQAQLTARYHEFDEANTELKSIVTAWQMKDGQTPNDHTDAAYDTAVIDRLAGLNDRFSELLAGIVGKVPRLAHYPKRFSAAIGKIRAGEPKFVASPIVDSYHQVWFELHEELIGLLGRTRAEEAAAGRAV